MTIPPFYGAPAPLPRLQLCHARVLSGSQNHSRARLLPRVLHRRAPRPHLHLRRRRHRFARDHRPRRHPRPGRYQSLECRQLPLRLLRRARRHRLRPRPPPRRHRPPHTRHRRPGAPRRRHPRSSLLQRSQGRTDPCPQPPRRRPPRVQVPHHPHQARSPQPLLGRGNLLHPHLRRRRPLRNRRASPPQRRLRQRLEPQTQAHHLHHRYRAHLPLAVRPARPRRRQEP